MSVIDEAKGGEKMDREGIGEKLKTLRMQKELSISDVSKATGVSESTIYNYEAGYRVPRETLIK